MRGRRPQDDHLAMSPHAFRYEESTIPEGMTVEQWRELRRRRAAAQRRPRRRWRALVARRR